VAQAAPFFFDNNALNDYNASESEAQVLIYKDSILPSENKDFEVIAKTLFAKLQVSAFRQVKYSAKELSDLDTTIAQLLSAPRGLIPEC